MVVFSDTNIFIDLEHTNLTEEFFDKFSDVYTEKFCFQSEMLRPKGIKETLIKLGLNITSATSEELFIAKAAQEAVHKLSKQDCISYAISKTRGWILITGDKRLRNYAEENGVEVHGFVWVMQKCLERGSPETVIKEAVNTALSHSKIMLSTELLKRTFPFFFEDRNL